ncbi:unnamed protein product [Arctia plantaginis]|uniref:Myrosinase 1-like n=1 Tax=Arctia plantaginis TaxID=874455 RepID=A0A8S0Z7B4_ARCPL|nr:unnamed protein product [Arctia plantaginis]
MRFFVLCLFNCLIGCHGYADTKKRSFPPTFMFGVASSAYQIEGAWDDDGKGESIWDRFVHENPERIADGYNGDVASDSYHLWRRDVEMLRELGVHFYRFSISWSRVMPTGLSNSINEAGFAYYDNLIDELLKYKIMPMVTLYHFDLPQYLQDLGGWINPLSSEWFEDYAAEVFKRYAHKVPFWITINQPKSICMDGYESNVLAPAVNSKTVGGYECTKNVLLAHAKAYRIYQNLYKTEHQGNVGISIELNWFDPVKNNTENAAAVARARAFQIDLYMHPIFSETGNFPNLVREIVARKSKEQGFTSSRLPTLTAEEIKLIRGSADFVGMNHYTSFLVQNSKKQYESPSLDDDIGVELSYRSEWKPSKSSWLKNTPYGIYRACIHVNINYNYPPMIVTEHGWSTGAGLGDKSRADNLRHYLNSLLLAMEDGTKLKGYAAWSLMDNVEWTAGTSERFGLYQVDFNSPTKNRTARLSALVYKNIIKTREVDLEWMPESLQIDIDQPNKVKVEL